MDGSRTAGAVARIEAAIARIERAVATKPTHAPENEELSRRNEALEDAVRHGLGELDRLITRIEG